MGLQWSEPSLGTCRGDNRGHTHWTVSQNRSPKRIGSDIYYAAHPIAGETVKGEITMNSKIIVTISLFITMLCAFGTTHAVEPTMAEYTSYPIFQANAVKPNILIIMDNSGSMNDQAYTDDYDHTKEYYGYFEPYKKYTYGSNIFERSATGEWDGNFLNWLCMRRVDVARKVLTGGKALSTVGGGAHQLVGEPPGNNTWVFTKNYDDTDNVTPLASGTIYTYQMENGCFKVNATSYDIKVQKYVTYDDEAHNFLDGNISGVLQRIGSEEANWGLEFFNAESGGDGGIISYELGANLTTLTTSLANTACNTMTPLAEAYYVAMKYFARDAVLPVGYKNVFGVNKEPFGDVPCAKCFVFLFTDGASTADCNIPTEFQNYDGDTNDTYSDACDCGGSPLSGSDYLDDLTLYARTNDLRPPTSTYPLDGNQNLIFYTVYAFGNDVNARNLLKDAAKNGGFEDKNGSNSPDLQAEWDEDSDDVPDTYFEAQDGHEIEAKVVEAINAILQRSASGTAVSVLATAGEGEGNVVQAFFKPSATSGTEEVKWLGFLQSLWVDDKGNLREDTVADYKLSMANDYIIKHVTDADGNTVIERYPVTGADPYGETALPETVPMTEIKPLWEAGKLLAKRDAADRTIYTFIDKDNDTAVDTGEFIEFATANAAALRPYFGVKLDDPWANYLGATHDNRTSNLINFIRGVPVGDGAYVGSPTLRKRILDVDGVSSVWKLGDIVHSTPMQVSGAVNDFYLLYSDESHDAYRRAYLQRETVVYAGANDGMLHAFTCGQYNTDTMAYTEVNATEIGSELWGYIPQCLLPHLKWLPSEDYTHVYYVDLMPWPFDAQIFADDLLHPKGWGTILLCGLRMGGKEIWSTDDFNGDGVDETRYFYSSYFCLDVTDPRNPALLWEKTYPNLELTTTIPSVLRVQEKWYCAIGSGPATYDGTSDHAGHVFIVDLKTGDLVRDFTALENNAFMSSAISCDYWTNNNVDCIYVGETYEEADTWKGKMYRIGIPQLDFSNPTTYVDDPNDPVNPWAIWRIFDSPAPITVPVDVGWNNKLELIVYFGTGRYISTLDKTDAQQQYLFGILDPFFDKDSLGYRSYSELQLGMGDLFQADGYKVFTDGTVTGGTATTFNQLLTEARLYKGWYKSLDLLNPSERVVNEGVFMGGESNETGGMIYLFLAPSFAPNADVCGFGGYSWLHALHPETGTACFVDIYGTNVDEILDKIDLGDGLASAPSIHIGKEKSEALIQDSLGGIKNIGLKLKQSSGFISWHEHPNIQN